MRPRRESGSIPVMITGAHFLLYSTNAEADRAFLRDILEFRSVDAGGGWLIFALPPSEVGVHPADGGAQSPAADGILGADLYLMCDDVQATVASLESRNVACGPIEDAGWGKKTTIQLPSGGRIGLYQPLHQTAI
jgi:hypothetical protein